MGLSRGAAGCEVCGGADGGTFRGGAYEALDGGAVEEREEGFIERKPLDEAEELVPLGMMPSSGETDGGVGEK